MEPKEFYQSFQKKRGVFLNFIKNIKRKAPWNIYTIINPTLIANSYSSSFPKNFFSNSFKNQNKIIHIIKNIINFYLKNIFLLINYFISFIF